MAERSQKLSLMHKVEISNNAENPILQIRLTPTQSNFMWLYLSKIDARKPETKQVVFSLSEYANIMELKGRVSTTRIIKATKSLYALSYSDYDPEEQRIKLIHAFDNFEMYKEDDEWYITISCHKKAEKHFFDLSKYTEFEVWNVLSLANPTHRMMYTILKQHEKLKFRELTLKELRKLLLLKDSELSEWKNFKRMLDFTEKALKENTDIYFTWEILSKKGKGGKVHSLRFNIFKNKEVINRPRQMHIEGMEDYYQRERDVAEELHQEAEQIKENLEKFQEAIEVEYEEVGEESPFEYYREALRNEFSLEEVEELYRHALPYIQSENPSSSAGELKLKMYDYFMLKHSELNAYKKKISSRIGLLKSFIKADARGGWDK